MSLAAPRFSILLPTHERPDVLGCAIRSVLAQTEGDFELLVVLDGCGDATRAVLAGFDDARIRVFDLPKAPHFGYANRNIALREARGRLVAFAAHDDLLLPDHLALMGALLEDGEAEWGYSRPLWVSTDGIIVPFATNLAVAEERQEFLAQRNTIPAACIVHSRAVLERVGYWPEEVPSAGDWVLWRRMLAASGGRGARLPQPTNLHFSADWRRSRYAGSEEVRHLIGLAESAAWWPAILRQPPAGEPEQATLWRAMESGGPAWVSALRSATDMVLDRIAWMSIVEGASGQREAALAAQAAQAAAERDAAQAALAVIRASTSWRVTAPLRGLARLVRGEA